MAEMKIDITKVVERSVEIVMDETTYAGKTIREWIADITNGKYVSATQPRFEFAYSWDFSDNPNFARCPACDERFRTDRMNGKLWNFCPACGVRMERDNDE